MKHRLSLFIKIFISVLLLGLLFYFMRGEYGKILQELKQTNLWLYAAAIIVYAGNISTTTVRLKILLKAEGIKMPFLQLQELTMIGFFFNNFMPSSIGGDIIKAYYTGEVTNQKAKSYVSVFMDRLTGLFSFAGVGFIALIVGWNAVKEPIIRQSVLIFVLLCCVVAIVALNPTMAKLVSRILSKIHIAKIGEKLLKIYNMLHNYRNRQKILINTIMISTVSQALYFYIIYILFKALNTDISLKVVFLLMPIVCVITLLPSLGGLGLREGAIVALFAAFAGKEKAFGVSVLLLSILFLISLLGGIIYISSPQFRSIKIKEEEELL